MILDDTFSAMDENTATIVAHNLFAKQGLLRKMKTTVVYAGSNGSGSQLPFHTPILIDTNCVPQITC